MGLFNRNRQPQEPLLARADVARFIDRSPARVTQYYRSDQMPEPDLYIGDDNPVWLQSTVRNWWLSRGGAVPGDSKRYHLAWDPIDGAALELLEEEIVTAEGPFRATYRFHTRVYRAMDGGPPVILLGMPGSRYVDLLPRDWPTIKQSIARQLDTDTELSPALWILTANQSTFPDSYENAARTGAVPSPISLVDLDDPDATIVPADVARLIGGPIEIFPQEYYTEEAISQRKISSARQEGTPTTITIDPAGLGTVLAHMRTLDQAAQNSSGPDQSNALKFAAGVQADRALQLGEDAKVSDRLYTLPYGRDPQQGAGEVALAIRVRDRDLSLAEEHFARSLQLDEPLHSRHFTAEPGHGPRYKLRTDIQSQLAQLRHVLMDPQLPEDSAVRAAAADSEKIVADIVRHNDAKFARDDRHPMAVTHHDQDVVSIYLDQLEPVTVESLPYELKRRAQLLLDYEYAQWENKQLLLDEANGLLAVRGVEPSRLSPEQARDLALSNWRATPEAMRGERPTTEWLEAETHHYRADQPQAYIEWPTNPAALPPSEFARRRLIAPPASISVERPVFLRAPDDNLLPLPLAQTNFSGHVWGVSGTDSISRAVHSVLTDAETRDWKSYPDETEDPGLAAYRHLTRLFGSSGGRAVDIDCSSIAKVYADLGILRETNDD